MSSERFKMIVAVHLFLVKDNTVLLARRFQTGWEDGNFSVPAGHVDGNETLRQAMIREAKEEVGITIHEDDLEFAHVMHRLTDREACDFFFVCQKWEGTPEIREPEKCNEIGWFAFDQLPENTIGYIRKALQHFQRSESYSELGWK